MLLAPIAATGPRRTSSRGASLLRSTSAAAAPSAASTAASASGASVPRRAASHAVRRSRSVVHHPHPRLRDRQPHAALIAQHRRGSAAPAPRPPVIDVRHQRRRRHMLASGQLPSPMPGASEMPVRMLARIVVTPNSCASPRICRWMRSSTGRSRSARASASITCCSDTTVSARNRVFVIHSAPSSWQPTRRRTRNSSFV